MEVKSIDNTAFRGKLIITNDLSSKPNQCINNVHSNIENLIKNKSYNLYVVQDYSTSKINIYAGDVIPTKESEGICQSILATSASDKYINAAKQAISDYEKAIEEQCVKENKKQERKELLSFMAFNLALPFMIIAEEAKEGFKDLKTIYNKLATKLATKKG